MRRLLVLAVLPLLAACGGGREPSAAPRGVLEGRVTRGPVTPTCVKGQPCTEPAAGITLRFSRDRAVGVHVRTGGDGSYRVALAAGRYAVFGPGPIYPRAVSVAGSGVAHVDFTLDTEIR